MNIKHDEQNTIHTSNFLDKLYVYVHSVGGFNFQPLPSSLLSFIAIVIRFCDRVDFGVSHLKSVV